MAKDVVTIKCMCGNEWDFKSPITLLDTRIVTTISSPNTTYSIDVIKPIKPKKGK